MWTEIAFVVDGALADAWSDALFDAGAASVHCEDADVETDREQALFDEPGERAPRDAWPRTRVTALVDRVACDEDSVREWLSRAGRVGELPTPSPVDCRTVADEDWVRKTQQQFAPFEVGRRLRITPSWHLPDGADLHGAAAGVDARQTIVLDPGLAFGTGSHPTTRLCLEWLDEHLRPGDSVIDYGCGSGILAIAAARLGAATVSGIDIDAQALASARHNAAVNGVTMDLRSPEEAPPQPADVVVANILANPLRVLAPLLEERVAHGGSLVLAGLLDRQAAEIAACYRACELRAWRSLDGWTCLAGTRRS